MFYGPYCRLSSDECVLCSLYVPTRKKTCVRVSVFYYILTNMVCYQNFYPCQSNKKKRILYYNFSLYFLSWRWLCIFSYVEERYLNFLFCIFLVHTICLFLFMCWSFSYWFIEVLYVGVPLWLSWLTIWLGLRSRSQDPAVKPHVRLPTHQGVCLSLFLSPASAHALSL